MLIMTWAQARFSGDTHLINEYYDLLAGWGDYLIQNTLNPNGFQSADGLVDTNMSNLAIKGIIGIRAMGEIAQAHGRNDDATKYNDAARSQVQQWQSFAISDNHLVSIYGRPDTWGLMFNLFPDKWLRLNLADQLVFTNQTHFYSQRIVSAPVYGLGFDGQRSDIVKSHWLMFTAATTTDDSVRNAFIGMMHFKISDNTSRGVFPSEWAGSNGTMLNGQASPAQGASFAPLALSMESVLDSDGSTSSSGSGSSAIKTGAIAGGVVGGIVFIALVVLGIVFWRKRSRQQETVGFDERASGWDSSQNGLNNLSDPRSLVPSQERIDRLQQPIAFVNEPSHPDSYNTQNPDYVRNNDHVTPQAPPLPRKGQQPGIRTHLGQSELVSLVPPRQTSMQHQRGLSSQTSSSSALGRSDDASELRNEVETLRREMEELRSRGLYEPPPQYS